MREDTERRTEVDTPSGAVAEGEVRPLELFGWMYRLFYSKTFGLLIILAFAVLSFFGAILPQETSVQRASDAAHQRFLVEVSQSLGGWTTPLDALGLFHVFSSTAFFIVVAALALSILACTTHRIPELWNRVYHPRVHVSSRFFDKARYRGRVSITTNADQPKETLEKVLRSKGWRVESDPQAPERRLYADRHAWSGVGTVLAHISFIMILAAFVASSRFGIDEPLTVPVGGSVEIGHGTGLTVFAHSFTDTYAQDGTALDYVADLSVLRGEQEVARQEVRVNEPLSIEGYRLHQTTFGNAVDVKVESESGDELFSGSVPLTWTTSDRSEVYGRADLSDGRIVVVATAASGKVASSIPPGNAIVEIHDDEASGARSQKQIRQGETTSFEGLTFTFERERQYTGLTLRKDPGEIWMWIGSALLIIGMSVTFLLQYRRLWVDIGDEAVRFGSVSRLDVSFERVFSRIVEDVDIALNGEGTTTPDIATTIGNGSGFDDSPEDEDVAWVEDEETSSASASASSTHNVFTTAAKAADPQEDSHG